MLELSAQSFPMELPTQGRMKSAVHMYVLLKLVRVPNHAKLVPELIEKAKFTNYSHCKIQSTMPAKRDLVHRRNDFPRFLFISVIFSLGSCNDERMYFP